MSGLAALPDAGALVTMTAAGLAFALGGLAAYRARAWVEDQSLYTRRLRTRRIDAADLRSLRRRLRGTPATASCVHTGVVIGRPRREPIWAWLWLAGGLGLLINGVIGLTRRGGGEGGWALDAVWLFIALCALIINTGELIRYFRERQRADR